jgi:hypothetical protein
MADSLLSAFSGGCGRLGSWGGGGGVGCGSFFGRLRDFQFGLVSRSLRCRLVHRGLSLGRRLDWHLVNLDLDLRTRQPNSVRGILANSSLELILLC